MELRHLRYFIAVAEELNITRAAARLNVSQPPLSRQMRDLEDELGVTLLHRSPKAVVLTPAGRTFLREARKVMAQAAQAVQLARAASVPKESEIKVGYAPTPTLELLPRALRLFQKTTPTVHPVLLDLATDDMVEGVMNRSLDVGVLVNTPLKGYPKVAFKLLFKMPVGIIVPPTHRFARRRSVSLDEALSEPLVAYIRRGYSDYHHWLAEVLKHTTVRPRMLAQADGAASLIASVISGQGVAFGMSTFVILSGKRVKFVPLSTPVPPLEIGCIYSKGRRPPAVEAFIQSLEEGAAAVRSVGH